MIPVKWLRYIFAAPLIIGIIQGIFEHNRDEALGSLLFAPLFFLCKRPNLTVRTL